MNPISVGSINESHECQPQPQPQPQVRVREGTLWNPRPRTSHPQPRSPSTTRAVPPPLLYLRTFNPIEISPPLGCTGFPTLSRAGRPLACIAHPVPTDGPRPFSRVRTSSSTSYVSLGSATTATGRSLSPGLSLLRSRRGRARRRATRPYPPRPTSYGSHPSSSPRSKPYERRPNRPSIPR